MSDHQVYTALEKRIANWAANQSDLNFDLVVGSRARLEHPPDEWSDLDLILFSRDPSRLENSSAWLNQFGVLWFAQVTKTGHGDREWIAVYAVSGLTHRENAPPGRMAPSLYGLGL